jgi:hypothetical protein
MARMSIDDMATRDPRILVLAKLAGMNRFEAVGRLLEVWSVCYDRVSPYLSEVMIDASAAIEGFAKHMLEAELATRESDGRLRVHGVKQRIKYLEAKSEAGRRGGIKSGESRRNRHEAKPKQSFKQSEAALNPSAIPIPPASVPEQERPASPTRVVTDAFQTKYLAAYGAKPTWPPKTTKHVQDLLRSHSADEIAKRIRILFETPPPWLKPPFDFGTLVQHFDKLVAAPSQHRQEPLRVLQDLTRRPA